MLFGNKKSDKNNRRKLFVVSDVHGYLTKLRQVLAEAGFEENNEEHLLICCGDYFNYGSENYEMLRYLRTVKNKVLVRGNHEDVFLGVLTTGKVAERNLINGSIKNLEELFGKENVDIEKMTVDFSSHQQLRREFIDFILGTRNFFETENYVFFHGWYPFEEKDGQIYLLSDWHNATQEKWAEARKTKWTKVCRSSERIKGKTIVVGHYPTFFASEIDFSRSCDNADIYFGDGVIAIDAGTKTTGKINVFVTEDNVI